MRIDIDDETLKRVDQAGKALGWTRFEIVRHALGDWLRRHEAATFEREWIEALRARPDQAGRAEDWSGMRVRP